MALTNTGKDHFSRGYVQTIVNVLMAVFYESFHKVVSTIVTLSCKLYDYATP